MTETAYIAIDLTETSAAQALELAREAFPYHEIELDDMGGGYALDSFGLDWLVEYGSDHAILVDYDHADIVTLCGNCAYWLEYGETAAGDDTAPSADLEELAEAGLNMLSYTEGGTCDGCESYHEIAYSGGGYYYTR